MSTAAFDVPDELSSDGLLSRLYDEPELAFDGRRFENPSALRGKDVCVIASGRTAMMEMAA